MSLQKEYVAKLFDQDGTTFLKNIPLGDGGLKEIPSFTSRINGGLGQMVLDLDMSFDNVDSTIDFMDVVDLYVMDADNPRGRRVYRGFISRIEPYVDGQEGVRVTCLGLASLLAFSHYKNGASFAVTHSTQDPEAIFKAIVDHFNTIYGGSLLSYGGVTSPVGTNVSVTFTDQKWIDAITKTIELAGTDWYWKVDADGKCHFAAKPGSATHTLIIGEDIESLSCLKNSENVVNDVQVRRFGGTASDYSSSASQATYGTGSPGTGRRTKIVSDASLTDAGAADQRGNKAINDGKDAKLSARITLGTKADLEGIEVGDTVNVRNHRKGNTFIPDNMLIVSTTYRGDALDLELEQPNADFGVALQQFVDD